MVPARPAGPRLALSVWPDVTSLPASQRPLEAGGAAFPAAIKGLTRGSHVRGRLISVSLKKCLWCMSLCIYMLRDCPRLDYSHSMLMHNYAPGIILSPYVINLMADPGGGGQKGQKPVPPPPPDPGVHFLPF